MTKANEREAINISKERVIDYFKKSYGFAPSKKDIRPMECSYDYIKDFNFYYCEYFAFCVRGIGYALRGITVERAEVFDL